MQKYPKVSIITPFFNSSHFPETIKSVLSQSYKNREWFIVNDFVGHGPICKNIASNLEDLFKDEPRTLVMQNTEHLPIPVSRNNALEKASGEYIAFLDHDDVRDKEKLSKQVACMQQNPELAIVGTNALRIDQYGIGIQEETMPSSDDKIRKLLPYHVPFRMSSIIVRKSIIDTIGGLDENFYYCDDKDLILSSAQCGQIYNMQEALIQYRWHGENISNKQAQEVSKEALRCIIKHKESMPIANYLPALIYHSSKAMLSRDMKNFLRPYFMKLMYHSKKSKI